VSGAGCEISSRDRCASSPEEELTLGASPPHRAQSITYFHKLRIALAKYALFLSCSCGESVKLRVS